MTKILEEISAKQIKDTPKLSSGDTVVVSVKVKEGKRERVQAFEGVVVAVKIEELVHHLLSEKYHMVRALREYFKHIAP